MKMDEDHETSSSSSSSSVESIPHSASAGSDEFPEYWVPGEEEQGLLEVMHILPKETRVYLYTRPVEELRGNLCGYDGGWVDVTGKAFIQGKEAVLREGAVAYEDRKLYSVKGIAEAIGKLKENSYVLVSYRDWSRWASRVYHKEVRGGFGCPTQGGMGIILNPFQQGYVDRYFAVALNSGPAYFVEMEKVQYMLGQGKCHENKLKGVEYLTEDQFDEVMSYVETKPPAPPSDLNWDMTLNVAAWPLSQLFSLTSFTLLTVTGLYLRSLKSTLSYLAIGFFTFATGSFLASHPPTPTIEAPFTTISTGLLSLSLYSAPQPTRTLTMSLFSAISLAANYRLAVWRSSVVA
eukprot:TRINITY_DN7397_c0_g1_i1.p1 TRINITY_DN7397_c0_g1~~TRINITY_DN7397_c0_g1_i1.p1  ORF type:complete len:349 (+),score=51.78 TRINITY_DN7397_c0_g1_i1:928-1974(+)